MPFLLSSGRQTKGTPAATRAIPPGPVGPVAAHARPKRMGTRERTHRPGRDDLGLGT